MASPGERPLNLLDFQSSCLAAAQAIEADGTNGDAAQHHDLVAQPRQHAADLAILALVEDDFQPGAVPLRFQALDAAGADVAVAEPDPLEQLLHVLGVRMAGDLDVIRLVDAEAWVHQAIGQLAVVCQKKQPFAVLIEPAHGVDALADVRHEVDGARPAGGIEVGAEVAARLVDQPVDELFGVERLPVHAHGGVRLDARAQLADHAPTDGDAAAEDQIFAVPARADTGMRQEFVETIHKDHCNAGWRS